LAGSFTNSDDIISSPGFPHSPPRETSSRAKVRTFKEILAFYSVNDSIDAAVATCDMPRVEGECPAATTQPDHEKTLGFSIAAKRHIFRSSSSIHSHNNVEPAKSR
jgi:hypothetical protein